MDVWLSCAESQFPPLPVATLTVSPIGVLLAVVMVGAGFANAVFPFDAASATDASEELMVDPDPPPPGTPNSSFTVIDAPVAPGVVGVRLMVALYVPVVSPAVLRPS